MRQKFSLDIESLSTPEVSGYDIIIPNYAVVQVPEVLTSDLKFVYFKLPFQAQIDSGLKLGAGAMSFWFDMCKNEYPHSLEEVLSTFKSEHAIKIDNNGMKEVSNVPYELMKFLGSLEIEIYGNGCNFDCSVLQANHRLLYGIAELWKYDAPQNARTLKNLLNEAECDEMKDAIKTPLSEFKEHIFNTHGITLELHNPLYDAAREALQISYCLSLKKS